MTSERERFEPDELAMVLSHYDLGVISTAKEFTRGSRRSPKLLLETPNGRYLLKRRAVGRDDPLKVAFAHALTGHLLDRKFPVPALIGTREDNNSLLQLGGHVYEVFTYIEGERYDYSLEQTASAGRALAKYHLAVADFHTEWNPPATAGGQIVSPVEATFPPLAGSEIVAGSAEIPIRIVLHGLQGPLTVKGQRYNGTMPAWGQFSDADIAATLTYVRSQWGNAAAAVTAAQVAAVRQAPAGRNRAWTGAEIEALLRGP
jgi:hypothetical protein